MATWKRASKGVFYRTHPTRKHGVRFDRYYAITYQLDGKQKWEKLGWASDGMDAEEAGKQRKLLIDAHSTGEGVRTLREKKEAEAEKDKKRKELAIKAKQDALTFSDFWQSHYWPMQSHKAEGSKVAELSLYTHWIQPAIGDKRLIDIAPFELERLKASMLKEKKSPGSIKYAFAVVSQVWTLALRDEYVTTACPTRKVKLPVVDNKRLRHLSPEEAKALLEELKKRSPQSHDMAVLALYAGMRFGEIAALTWHDVDLERGIITIRDPKGKQNRRAFISEPIREVLEARKGKSGIIFKRQGKPSKDGKKSEKMERVSNTYRQIANALFNQGVTDSRQEVTFHTLRHTFASWLVEKGTSLYAVKELMGHADFKMTQRYSHLAPDGLREAAKSLEGNLEAKPVKLQVVNKAD